MGKHARTAYGLAGWASDRYFDAVELCRNLLGRTCTSELVHGFGWFPFMRYRWDCHEGGSLHVGPLSVTDCHRMVLGARPRMW